MNGDILPLILVLVWVLFGLSGIGRKGRSGNPPSRPGRPQRRPAPGGYRRPGEAARHGSTQPGETAESMLPDELWAILTGQAPSRPAPRPQPEPEPRTMPSAEEGWVSEPPEARSLEYVDVEERREREVAARRTDWDEALNAPPPAPLYVPGPSELLDDEARHVAFEQRMAEEAAARATAAARPHAPRLSDALRGRSELRRAVLLSEVLGPPKALR